MDGQLHITRRADYLRGRQDGYGDALRGDDYEPRGAAVGSEDRVRAYALGYGDGWDEGNPCSNGTCSHLAHTG